MHILSSLFYCYWKWSREPVYISLYHGAMLILVCSFWRHYQTCSFRNVLVRVFQRNRTNQLKKVGNLLDWAVIQLFELPPIRRAENAVVVQSTRVDVFVGIRKKVLIPAKECLCNRRRGELAKQSEGKQAKSKTAFFRDLLCKLQLEGVAPIQGVSSHLKCSSQENPLQVCPLALVLIDSRCNHMLTNKISHDRKYWSFYCFQIFYVWSTFSYL